MLNGRTAGRQRAILLAITAHSRDHHRAFSMTVDIASKRDHFVSDPILSGQTVVPCKICMSVCPAYSLIRHVPLAIRAGLSETSLRGGDHIPWREPWGPQSRHCWAVIGGSVMQRPESVLQGDDVR